MIKHAILLCFLLGTSFCLCGCQQERPSRPVPEAALTYLSFSESSSYFKRVQSYEFRIVFVLIGVVLGILGLRKPKAKAKEA